MAPSVADNPLIGSRIERARNELDLTQEELARQLGLNSRQSLQAMEAGNRRVQVDELLRLIEITGKPLEYFTDPFYWVGQGVFSFRAVGADEKTVDNFEDVAGPICALWEWTASKINDRPSSRPCIGISPESSFEDAQEVAERLGVWWTLGATPADVLAETIERELGVPVLFMDIADTVSGATCRMEDRALLFVNRRDIAGRRNFDLAHELFHLLAGPGRRPPRIDDPTRTDKRQKRMEQLAENFAGALLMPENGLRQVWDSFARSDSFIEKVRAIAEGFRVSGSAARWRCHNLGLMTKDEAREFDMQYHDAARSGITPELLPLMYSTSFLRSLGVAIEAGEVSVRRLARILLLDIDSLAALYQAHSLKVPFDL